MTTALMQMHSLKREAATAARQRGHNLFPWKGSALHAWTTCRQCGKRVDVLGKPQANEIDIAGEAIALGCGDA